MTAGTVIARAMRAPKASICSLEEIINVILESVMMQYNLEITTHSM
jgi:hypothetical protein